MEIKIIPGILEKDFEEIKKKVNLVAPYVDTIQIDLCDGKLVPNTNFSDPEPFREIIKDKMFELHMMVSEPGEIVEDWVSVGFKRIIGHIEGLSEPMEFINDVKSKGLRVGLGLDFDSRLSTIENYLDFVDFILIMTVKAGFSGQSFGEQSLEKIRKLRQLRPNLDIEVDGGMNIETARSAKDAGANLFVSTGYIFNGDVKENINKLRQI